MEDAVEAIEPGIDEVSLEINRGCKGDLYIMDAWLARASTRPEDACARTWQRL